ncbi:H-type lectin domain-containing protein [Roseovarius nanhaiticus]|uniref:H-type lectin domain-containing protein n=1 Tax=Roseovarius nanhaiticus TaxID=573024 RepID=UPI0024910500|nr:H-type lectin domain-containing protein [Roseovarius nanhaiticus]
MKRIDTKLMGIDQGETVLFSDFEKGGAMWTGEGERTRRHSIRFTERFRALPAVHCALSMWDIDSGTNARVEISAEKITQDGFEVVFRTWADTHIARARVRWMAIGEVSSEEDWDLY